MGFVILFFLYLMACAAIANWAAAQGRDFWTVFFIGLAVSPLATMPFPLPDKFSNTTK